ncbi:MAG: hypothetical protein Ct9H90mP9_3420 [Pseudomonadota bacterium]|nr:MAG: hypothetical protein Ct9H90mP9_3420 [Pseudomonadota bacterium]
MARPPLELYTVPKFSGIHRTYLPRPCEDSCVLNKHYPLDPEEKIKKKHAVTIERVEKHIAERGWGERGGFQPQPPKRKPGKKLP